MSLRAWRTAASTFSLSPISPYSALARVGVARRSSPLRGGGRLELIPADVLGCHEEELGGGVEAGMRSDGLLRLALRDQPLGIAVVGVVVVEVMHAGCAAFPLRIQRFGHPCHRREIPSAVGDEEDVGEPVGPETARRVLDEALEVFVGERDRARVAHVAGRRIHTALRHVRHDRSDERAPERLGDPARGVPHDVGVLPDREMRPVLLGARGGKEDRRVTGSDRFPGLDRGQFLEKDAARCLLRPDVGCDEEGGARRGKSVHDPVLSWGWISCALSPGFAFRRKGP